MRSTPRTFLLPSLGLLLVAVLMLPGLRADATTHERISAPLSLRLSTGTVTPRGSLLISGTGYSSGERVDLYVGIRSAGAVTADAGGAFTGARFTVPAATPPGSVAVVATGRYSRFTAQAQLTVQSAWAEPSHDARHTENAADENVVSPANVAQLAPVGQIGTDTGPSRVTVANGSIYLAYGDGSGMSSTTVTATGASWSHADPYAGNGATIATATRVFYPSNGELQALDARTGKSLWRTAYRANGSQDALSAFDYADGAVYAVVGSGYRHTLSRLSAATGAVAWTLSGLYDSQPPAVTGGLVYAREGGDAIEAIDATTGDRIWTRTIPATDTGVLVVSGAYLVAPFRYGLAVLDRATGAIVWNSAAGATGNVAVTADRVVANYFDFATGDTTLTALDLATGQRIWNADASYSPPVVANGVVYTGYGQHFYAYDLATGDRLATFDLPELDPNSLPELDSSPSVVDGVVYAPVQYYGNRFEGAGVIRYALPDREGVPAVRPVDDTVVGSGEGQLRYAGGWVAGSRAGAYQDTFHYARSAGATATTTFTGVGARIWYSAAPGFGRVSVSIDGRVVATLDQSSPVRRDGIKSWTSGELTRGSHTVVVTALAGGAVVDLDRVDLGTF